MRARCVIKGSKFRPIDLWYIYIMAHIHVPHICVTYTPMAYIAMTYILMAYIVVA